MEGWWQKVGGGQRGGGFKQPSQYWREASLKIFHIRLCHCNLLLLGISHPESYNQLLLSVFVSICIKDVATSSILNYTHITYILLALFVTQNSQTYPPHGVVAIQG